MVNFRLSLKFFLFISGIFLGLYFGNNKCLPHASFKPKQLKYFHNNYVSWFNRKGFKRKLIPWDVLRYDNKRFKLESDVLKNEVQVHCIILQRNVKNVKSAKATWAKNCNILTIVNINVRKDILALKRSKENSSWTLLCNTFKSIHSYCQWYLIVNDDTFVILENLRYFLAGFNSREMHYFGYAVRFWNTVYNLGQAGYVLSNAALQVLNSTISCAANSFSNREDFYLGKQLANLNITPVDTRDVEGLSTFHPHSWYQVFFPQESYYKVNVFPVQCCSKRSITFRAVEGDKMYTYYYLLYQLQIFNGGRLGNKLMGMGTDEDQVWKRFLKERNITEDDVSAERYYKIWEDLIDDPTSFAANMKRENFN